MPRYLVFLILLAGVAEADDRPNRQLLLIGQAPDDHPPATHEYLPGVRVVAALLKDTPGLTTRVVSADGPWTEGPELLAKSDGAVLFVSQGAKWIGDDPRRLRAFADLAQRGGGLTTLHWGMGTRETENIGPFLKLFGGCHGGPDRKFKVIEVKTEILPHPVTSGLDDFRIKEEFYYRLKFVRPGERLRPLLLASIDGEAETVCWAWTRPDGGRSFGYSGLHFHDNWRREEIRRLVAQGVLWTLALPIPKNGLDVKVNDEVLQLSPATDDRER